MNERTEIEKNVIFALVKNGDQTLIEKISLDWFKYNVNKTLWSIAVKVAIEQKQVDYELVRGEAIKGFDEKQRKILLRQLDEICQKQRVLYGKIETEFYDYYCKNKITELNEILVDQNTDIETKRNQLALINKQITEKSSNAEIQNLHTLVSDYLIHLQSGKKSEFEERSIELCSRNLVGIFGEKIRPYPIVIASRTGIGKTIFLINIVNDLLHQRKSGMFFATEDNAETLTNKIIGMRTALGIEQIISGDLQPKHKEAVEKLREEINKNNLYVYDKRVDVLQFRKLIEKQMAYKKVDFIAFDFIQTIIPQRGQKAMEALEDLMKCCVEISHQFYVPIFLISQTNDRDEKKSGKIELDLGDLKGAAAIEEYARIVILIEGERGTNYRTLYKAKNTGGAICKTDTEWNMECGKLLGIR